MATERTFIITRKQKERRSSEAEVQIWKEQKNTKKEREASGRCIEQAQLNQSTASDCEELQSKSRKWRSMKLAVHETAEQH